jgi:1,4-alpha-glucan branching enzyme
VSGSFNNWDPDQLIMNKTATGWELPLYLAEGTYTYRFVADRRWMEDPANKEHYPNEFGEYNSVLRIGKPYLFYLEGQPNAKQVILTGSFNGWRDNELYMKKTEKGWELPYTLGTGNYEYNFIIDGKRTAAPTANNSNVNKNSGNFYFVIGANHVFRLKGFKDAKEVYLAGDFNSWSPNTFAMKKEGDEWVMSVHLSAGKHLYKYVVDGKWIIDPNNKLWEQNENNTGNSVLWIDK